MDTDIPETICEHCKNVDFVKIYENLQHSYFVPPRKATILIDAEQYPVLRSAATLKRSAETCRCCDFLYRELRTAVYVSYPINERKNQLEDLPKSMQNIPLILRAVPKQMLLRTDSGDGRTWRSPIFLKSLVLGFEDEELHVSADMLLATTLEQFMEPNQENPLVHCRAISRTLTTQSAADLIRYWHGRCIADHQFCCDNQGSMVPTRLLDVGTAERPYVRLIETSSEHKKYIALSYCWGKVKQTTTIGENFKAFKSNIKESMLPATIRHAIKATRELQVRYLWVDALCIIQDSKDDWISESLKMADVYGSAYLTIIASRAPGVHEGFLQPRTDTELSFGSTNEGGSQRTVYLISDQCSVKKSLHEFESTPVGNRAWCFQERRISGRKVHFREDQLVWECSQATFYENGLSYNKAPEFVDHIYRTTEGHHEISEEMWTSMIESFTSCEITKSTDRLPALSGIAKLYAAYVKRKDLAYLGLLYKENKPPRYFAGNWETHMPHTLLWRVIDNSAPRQSSEYVAPSWSWASAPGPVKFMTSGASPLGDIYVDPQYYVDCAGKDAFGQVRGGWVSMDVVLLEGRCVPSQSLEDTYDFTTPRLRTKVENYIRMRGIPCGVYLDYHEDVSETLYAAFMYSDHRIKHEEPTWSGILLRKLRAGNAEFERVGCFTSCTIELEKKTADYSEILEFVRRIKIL
ncbi:hypothetical protein ACMFMG_007907 [Clarireedia jacksonii]